MHSVLRLHHPKKESQGSNPKIPLVFSDDFTLFIKKIKNKYFSLSL